VHEVVHHFVAIGSRSLVIEHGNPDRHGDADDDGSENDQE
jgi:hypothetical protein